MPVAVEPARSGSDPAPYRLTAVVVSVAERTSRHTVAAILLQDSGPPRVVPGASIAMRPLAPAQWTMPDGRTRTGLVAATPQQPAGTAVRIWVDRAGGPVQAPATADEAATRAALQAGLAALSCAVVIGLLGKVTSTADRRRRYTAIDREWEQVEPGWSGRRR
ncbi:Rv1733c family protein [Phytohabitans sp. LJ34]|uniref:Rv1733c family protein n=1 Tax=Phytohabitans sp. LJ34 TaxID=3452217 RepID=UPI003F8A2C0A